MEDEVNTSENGGEVNVKSDKELLDSYLKGKSSTAEKIEKPNTVEKTLSAEVQNEPKKTQGNRAQERIGELTRKYHSSKSELEKLRKEYEEYKKSVKPISREESANDEDYISKLTERQVNDRIANDRMKQLEDESVRAEQEAWTENVKSQVENFDEFANKYTKYAPVISSNDPITAEYVSKSSVGPKMLSELFARLEDERFADAWFSMPTAKKNITLYELEKYVSVQMQPTVQKQIPKAIIPGDGKQSNIPKSDKELLDEYLNRKRK